MHLLFEPTLQSVTRPYIKLNYCLSAILAVVHENCKTSWETTNGINSTNCLDEWKIESKSAICESFSPNPGWWSIEVAATQRWLMTSTYPTLLCLWWVKSGRRWRGAKQGSTNHGFEERDLIGLLWSWGALVLVFSVWCNRANSIKLGMWIWFDFVLHSHFYWIKVAPRLWS